MRLQNSAAGVSRLTDVAPLRNGMAWQSRSLDGASSADEIAALRSQ